MRTMTMPLLALQHDLDARTLALRDRTAQTKASISEKTTEGEVGRAKMAFSVFLCFLFTARMLA